MVSLGCCLTDASCRLFLVVHCEVECIRPVQPMKYLFALCLGASLALAQIPTTQQVPENSTTRVSDHVYAIIGFPNIAIVTGTRATLVVDTGMGPRNGA